MAGNSLLQACVFGSRAAAAVAAARATAARRADAGRDGDLTPPDLGNAPRAAADAVRADLRVAMSAGAGPIRSADGLDAADKALDGVDASLGDVSAATRDDLELHHAAAVARLLVRSARLRDESRGAHWRDDAPDRAARWDGVRLRVQVTAQAPRR